VLRLIRTADQLIHGDRADAESVRKRLQLVDSKCEDFTNRLDARRKNLIMARNFFALAQAVRKSGPNRSLFSRNISFISIVQSSSAVQQVFDIISFPLSRLSAT